MKHSSGDIDVFKIRDGQSYIDYFKNQPSGVTLQKVTFKLLFKYLESTCQVNSFNNIFYVLLEPQVALHNIEKRATTQGDSYWVVPITDIKFDFEN